MSTEGYLARRDAAESRLQLEYNVAIRQARDLLADLGGSYDRAELLALANALLIRNAVENSRVET